MSSLPVWIFTISLTMSSALFWVDRRAQKQNLPRTEALDLALILMIGATLGGRLLHVLWEEPVYYLQQPLSIFKIWQGGFVFYGGLFGALTLGAWWCRRHQLSLLLWADFFAPVIALTYALGRLGCFFNGCCYGRICQLPWAIDSRHPTQLYATLLELGALTLLLWLANRPHRMGQIFYSWLILHGASRILIEYFRDDPRGPLPLGISLSTWISVILISLAISQLKKNFVSK